MAQPIKGMLVLVKIDLLAIQLSPIKATTFSHFLPKLPSTYEIYSWCSPASSFLSSYKGDNPVTHDTPSERTFARVPTICRWGGCLCGCAMRHIVTRSSRKRKLATGSQPNRPTDAKIIIREIRGVV